MVLRHEVPEPAQSSLSTGLPFSSFVKVVPTTGLLQRNECQKQPEVLTKLKPANASVDLKTAVYTSFSWQPASVTNPTTKYYVPLVWTDPILLHATLQLTLVRFQAHGTVLEEVASS